MLLIIIKQNCFVINKNISNYNKNNSSNYLKQFKFYDFVINNKSSFSKEFITII